MIIRKLVILVGVLVAVIGTLQMLLRQTIENLARSAFAGAGIYALGAFSVIAGAILLWAGIRKLVRIHQVVLALGVLMFLSGVFVITAPAFARDVANSLYFNRAEVYRVGAAFFGGTLRIVIGLFLVYAGMAGPSPRTPRLGSIVPLA